MFGILAIFAGLVLKGVVDGAMESKELRDTVVDLSPLQPQNFQRDMYTSYPYDFAWDNLVDCQKEFNTLLNYPSVSSLKDLYTKIKHYYDFYPEYNDNYRPSIYPRIYENYNNLMADCALCMAECYYALDLKKGDRTLSENAIYYANLARQHASQTYTNFDRLNEIINLVNGRSANNNQAVKDYNNADKSYNERDYEYAYTCAKRAYKSGYFTERNDLSFLASIVRSCCFKKFYEELDSAERYLGSCCCEEHLDDAYSWLHSWTEFKESTGEYQYEKDDDDWERYYRMCSRNDHYNDPEDDDEDTYSY